ncbi:MAG: hypothetical protein H6713_00825 [Myxococcales bacterium]|nr:hypothetical protein [Myxococcales bacterium]
MRRPFLRCGLVGLAAVLMGLVLLAVLPSRALAMPEGFNNPLVAFEFARAPAELYALFGPTPTPEGEAVAAAMDLGNKLDFVFLLLYPGFFLYLSVAAARLSGRRWLWIGAGLAVVMAVGDALENVQLLALTSAWSSGAPFEPALTRLQRFTWVKWGGIAAGFAVFAGYLLSRATEGALARVTGAACLVTSGLGLCAWLLGPAWQQIYATAVLVAFAALVAFALAFTGRRAGA